MFMFYFVCTRHQVLLMCKENTEIFYCQFDDTIEVHILLRIKFSGVLRQVTSTPRDSVVQTTIGTEISSLLVKEAIVQVDDFPRLCLSPIFVIPKRSGGLRVIVNLKQMNLYILPQHFRMENLPVILPQLTTDV